MTGDALLLHGLFALGGGLGAVARHLTALSIPHPFPYATFVVNVVGCLLLGLGLMLLPAHPDLADDQARRVVLGFCGGFTTFSSFAYQSLGLHRDHSIRHAAINIVANLVVCLIAFAAGLWLGGVLGG